jgi:WD40 repeat protein
MGEESGRTLAGGYAGLSGLGPGARIAGYRLDQQVGAGGMAVVYRATDERLGRVVALKVLAPGLAADDDFRLRFIRESHAAAAVDDPHIIPVYEAGEAAGVLFIAMRYVPGGDLRSILKRYGPMPPARAAMFVSAVASALDAAHATGLVHCDVKPANMLVDQRPGRPDHVYLSDFGLSRGAQSSMRLTGTGQFFGSVDYCSPEQIQGMALDGRADQYGLACAAFELLTGAAPFQRDLPTAVIWAHMSTPPPPLSSRLHGTPHAADAVLDRALSKAPGDRYRSCREFADALRGAFGLAAYGHSTGAQHVGVPGVSHAGFNSIPPDAAGGVAATTVNDRLPAGSGGHGERAARHSRPAGVKRRALIAAIGAGVAAVVIAVALVVNSLGHGTAGSPGSAHTVARIDATAIGDYTWLHTLPSAGTSPSSGLAFSANGDVLAVAGGYGIHSTSLFSAATGHLITKLTDPASANVMNPGVFSVAYSPDGKTLAVADGDGDVYVWNTTTRSQTDTVSGGDAIAYSPDGKTLVVASGHYTDLWAAPGMQTYTSLSDPTSDSPDTVAFSPDGDTIAAGNPDGTISLWNASTRRSIELAVPAAAAFSPASSAITSVAFSPNGKILAAGNADGYTYLWNVASERLITTLTDPDPGDAHTSSVAFSPDGTVLASGDGQAFLWNMTTPKPRLIGKLTDPHHGSAGVTQLAFSPDGRTLATGDGNDSVYLWSVK